MGMQDSAETVALRALAWLSEKDDLLQVFMGATGLGIADLRSRAGDPELQAAVLDFLLMDDAWVVSFCESCGLPPQAPAAARAALPGGAQMHWT
jgi:hypothetical protein